jgi:branched-chain amino acid transport system substrate-binding protein
VKTLGKPFSVVWTLGLVVASGVSSASSEDSSTGPKASGASVSASTSEQATGILIKVGLICSCSGTNAPNSIPLLDVYTAWVKTVNASGGISGHPIRLISEDDGSLPGTSVSDIQTLIADHVDAIADDTDLDLTWASVVQAANIPVVGLAIPNVPYYTNPDFYSEGQTDDSSANAIVATAKLAGATNLGVVYCAEAPVCQQLVPLVRTAAKNREVPVVASESIAASAPNYLAQCVTFQQAHVSALAVFDQAHPIVRLGQDCSQQGYDPIYVTEGTAFSRLLAISAGTKNNLWAEFGTLPFFAATPANRAMNKAVDKYYPGLRNNPNVWYQGAALGWPSGILLEDAVKAGGLSARDTPSPKEIVKGLESLKGDTLEGLAPPLTFPAGQPHPIDCWFTARIHNGVTSLMNNGQVTCRKGSSS